jgi:hypothetical protein
LLPLLPIWTGGGLFWTLVRDSQLCGCGSGAPAGVVGHEAARRGGAPAAASVEVFQAWQCWPPWGVSSSSIGFSKDVKNACQGRMAPL